MVDIKGLLNVFVTSLFSSFFLCVDPGFDKASRQSLLLRKSTACLAHLTCTVPSIFQHEIYKLPGRERLVSEQAITHKHQEKLEEEEKQFALSTAKRHPRFRRKCLQAAS